MNILEKIDILEKTRKIFAYKKSTTGLEVIIQYRDGSFQLEDVKKDCSGDLYTDAYKSLKGIETAVKFAENNGYTFNFIPSL